MVWGNFNRLLCCLCFLLRNMFLFYKSVLLNKNLHIESYPWCVMVHENGQDTVSKRWVCTQVSILFSVALYFTSLVARVRCANISRHLADSLSSWWTTFCRGQYSEFILASLSSWVLHKLCLECINYYCLIHSLPLPSPPLNTIQLLKNVCLI